MGTRGEPRGNLRFCSDRGTHGKSSVRPTVRASRSEDGPSGEVGRSAAAATAAAAATFTVCNGAFGIAPDGIKQVFNQ